MSVHICANVNMCVSKLSDVVSKYDVSIHTYADDADLYIGFQPAKEFTVTISKLKFCLDEVK